MSSRARMNGALLEEGSGGMTELEVDSCSADVSSEEIDETVLCHDAAVSGTVEKRVLVPSSSKVTSLKSDSARDSLGVPLGGSWSGEEVDKGDSKESSAEFPVTWEGCGLESCRGGILYRSCNKPDHGCSKAKFRLTWPTILSYQGPGSVSNATNST